MADEISHSLLTVVKGTIDDSSIYLNLRSLQNFFKSSKALNPEQKAIGNEATEKSKKAKGICNHFGPPISHEARWRKFWDYFIILVAIYSTFTIPINFAFTPPQFNLLWFKILDWTTTLVYLSDIVIQFRTTYIDSFGLEVDNYKSIAFHYITSM